MRCRTKGFLSLPWQQLAEHAFFCSDHFIHCGQVIQLLRLNISASGIPLTKNIFGDFGPRGIVYRDSQFCVRFLFLGKLPNEWCVRNSTFIQCCFDVVTIKMAIFEFVHRPCSFETQLSGPESVSVNDLRLRLVIAEGTNWRGICTYKLGLWPLLSTEGTM